MKINVINKGPCDAAQLYQARAHAMGGSETFYHHPLVKCFNYTQGVKITKDMAQADWLMDLVAFKVIPFLRQCPAESGGFVGGDVFKVLLKVDRWPAPGAPAAVVEVWDRNGDAVRWASWDIESTDHPVGKWDFLLGRTMVGQRAVEMLWLPQED